MEDKNMKTKYSALIFVSALALLSACKKEVSAPLTRGLGNITAYIDNSGTKTAYTDETKFSWVEGDAVRVVVTNVADGHVDRYSQWAQSSGVEVDFDGTTPDGTTWEATGFAIYPSLDHGGSKSEGLTVTLPSVYEVSGDNYMSIIPLVGRADADNALRYKFRTAVGILKVRLANVPAAARLLTLNTTVNVSGVYPLNTVAFENGLGMSEALSGNTSVSVKFPQHTQGSDFAVYLPVAVGTIPAGATFSICAENGSELYTTPATVRDIPVQRAQLLDVTPSAPITYVVPTVDLTPVIGEYDMVTTAGPYSSNSTPGALVIAQSDDASKGNVMMTKFAGVSGKQYGTFDGEFITFPKDQIFGANPYEDAAEKPYVAIDFYKESVVDAQFQLLGNGRIKAVNADAMGLRTCTEADWQEYGGGWPWALCFDSVYAEFQAGRTQIALTEKMVSPCATETAEGSVAALVDGAASSYWHSPYTVAGTYDATYGVYIDIDLGEDTVSNFDVTFKLRDCYNDHPDHVKIYSSVDGTSWGDAAGELSGIFSGVGAACWTPFIACNGSSACRYIRISILSTNGMNGNVSDLTASGCTHMAELQIWKR